MKNLLILFIALFTAHQLQAQAFQEANRPMSQGDNNSFSMDFNIGNAETIAGLWVDYQKGFKAKKPKLNKKSSEYFTDNARLEKISSNTVDIYSTVAKKSDKGAVVTVWFDLGGAYLSSSRHPDRMAGANELMANFENIVKAAFAQEALEAEEDALKDLEKELKDLGKEQENVVKNIEKLEKELQDARQKIGEMDQAIGEKQKQIMGQEKMVEEAKAYLKKVKG